jgi:iron complex outermembrane receptor protein
MIAIRNKRLFLTAVLLLSLASAALHAQVQRPLTWLEDLNYLTNASASEVPVQRATVAQIRAEVEAWLKLHPDSKIELAKAPAQPWTPEQARSQVAALREVVEAIIKQDPDRPFHLGTAEVSVTGKTSELSPIADSIDQTEIAKRNELNVAAAMEDLPGVSISHSYSGRNQDMIWVHGFGYLQIPLYVDGILQNDPYDGTMDFRFIPTGDIAEVQMAKGFSSPLLGPNAVGGAINVVTKEPQKKLEGELSIGGFSGDGLQSSARLGSRWQHFFVQGSMDWTQNDYIPLSGNFITNPNMQPNDHMNNSYQQDAAYSGRFGWTPRNKDEYVFSYMNQKASGGIPLNTGNDPIPEDSCYGDNPSSCYKRGMPYRAWGYWDKTSYYFHSDTGVGESSSFKTRFFYDEYPNLMEFYTGLPYTYANLGAGDNTVYDDHSDGFTTEFDTRALPHNTISGSFFFKDDTHKEVPWGPQNPKSPPSSTLLSERQQISSIGLQDVLPISSRLLATVGFSADHLDGMRAANSNNSNLAFTAPFCPANTDLYDFNACTPHVWDYNPQASLSYAFRDGGKLFASFAQKTRFPALKDMYSFKLNQALPNPELQPERSQNWSFGYSRAFGLRTVAQLELFRSNLHDAIESVTVPETTNLCKSNSLNSPPAYVCSQDWNASKEVHEGVEFTVRSTPLSRLTLDASYTYLDKQIGGYLYQGQPIIGGPCGGGFLAVNYGQLTTLPNTTCLTPQDIPKNKAVLSAVLRLPRETMLMSVLRYESGTMYQDSFSAKGNSYYEIIPMSNFATLDVGGSAPLYKGASLQIGVKNLLDRNYSYVMGYPEEGRNWYVNLKYRF